MRDNDFLARAVENWGEALPDWVAVLAKEAQRTSQVAVAKRLGCSSSLISQVISAHYRGDIGRIEALVRGIYMAATLECPALGEISSDRCINEQAKNFIGTSAIRAEIFRACRSGCKHSKLRDLS